MVSATRLLLCAALLLLATSRQATAAPVNELRCQCLQTMAGIHLKNIQGLKVTPPGPHCTQTEVIATLKNGREVCLDPEAPLVQKIVQKMLK
ncbi:growth-regulated alpha protein isoform X2 [Arvicanthis niloticus]|nr:growth-regulated alpha protein isoform X2 [Arvicanthis niloticus]